MARRVQIGEGHADAYPINGVARSGGDAGRLRMVLVRIIAKVGVDTGAVKGHGMRQPLVALIAAHRDWTVLTVEFPAKIVVVFHLAKIRQHLLIGPLGVAPRGPVVIILRNATVQHLSIDGTRPAGHFATRDGEPVLLRRELRGILTPQPSRAILVSDIRILTAFGLDQPLRAVF